MTAQWQVYVVSTGFLRIVENSQHRWFTLADNHVIQGVMDKLPAKFTLCAG